MLNYTQIAKRHSDMLHTEYDPTNDAITRTEEDWALEERRENEQMAEIYHEYTLDRIGEC